MTKWFDQQEWSAAPCLSNPNPDSNTGTANIFSPGVFYSNQLQSIGMSFMEPLVIIRYALRANPPPSQSSYSSPYHSSSSIGRSVLGCLSVPEKQHVAAERMCEQTERRIKKAERNTKKENDRDRKRKKAIQREEKERGEAESD